MSDIADIPLGAALGEPRLSPQPDHEPFGVGTTKAPGKTGSYRLILLGSGALVAALGLVGYAVLGGSSSSPPRTSPLAQQALPQETASARLARITPTAHPAAGSPTVPLNRAEIERALHLHPTDPDPRPEDHGQAERSAPEKPRVAMLAPIPPVSTTSTPTTPSPAVSIRTHYPQLTAQLETAAPVQRALEAPPAAATPSATPAPAKPARVAAAAALPAAAELGSGPQDASDRAASIQAAPLSPHDQIQVLDLVTKEAALIRQQRDELFSVRTDVRALRTQVDDLQSDLGRRMSLVEASSGVAQAAQPVTVQASAARAAEPPRTARHSPIISASDVAAPGNPTISAAGHHYRIQAASPRLALITDADSSDGPSISVTPGDTLPGWGSVKSIAQRGTEWVIQTTHGTIE